MLFYIIKGKTTALNPNEVIQDQLIKAAVSVASSPETLEAATAIKKTIDNNLYSPEQSQPSSQKAKVTNTLVKGK